MRFKDPEEPAIATLNGTFGLIIDLCTADALPLGVGTGQANTGTMLRVWHDRRSTLCKRSTQHAEVDIEDPENGNMSAAVASEGGRLYG